MHNIHIHNLTLSKSEVSEVLLPKLLEHVFHFTTSKSWEQIRACGQIDINQDGKFGETSIHSEKSMGRHLGAICLFDLRNQSKKILAEDKILYDFLERRWEQKPSYFLFLRESLYPALLTLDKIDPDLKEKMMYIPEIESWHLGKLSLNHIEMIYRVQVLQD